MRCLLDAGGLELNFLVAVDYTASNGDPRDPASLHFISQRPTIYEGVGWPASGGQSSGRGTARPVPAYHQISRFNHSRPPLHPPVCRRHYGGRACAGALRHRQAVPRLGLWSRAATKRRRQPLLCPQRQSSQPRSGGGAGHPRGLQAHPVLCAAVRPHPICAHHQRCCTGEARQLLQGMLPANVLPLYSSSPPHLSRRRRCWSPPCRLRPSPRPAPSIPCC